MFFRFRAHVNKGQVEPIRQPRTIGNTASSDARHHIERLKSRRFLYKTIHHCAPPRRVGGDEPIVAIDWCTQARGPGKGILRTQLYCIYLQQ